MILIPILSLALGVVPTKTPAPLTSHEQTQTTRLSFLRPAQLPVSVSASEASAPLGADVGEVGFDGGLPSNPGETPGVGQALRVAPAQPLPLSFEATLLKTGSVTLPVGTWSLAAPLNPGANGTVIGYGCTLVPAAGYVGPAIDATGTGVQVVGCTIVGFKTGVWMRGPSLNSGRTAFIRDCEIDDYTGGYGIRWDSPSDGRIDNVTLAQRVGTNGLPWINGQIGISANSGVASLYLGSSAGGTTVENCHSWGNAAYDVADFAPDSILGGLRLEGGRLAHIQLAAWRIRFESSTIWEPEATDNGWHAFGIQIGDSAGIDARYCVVDGVSVGVGSTGNLGADVDVVHGSYNLFRLFRRKADPVPQSAGQVDSSSTYNWVTVP